MDFTVFHKKICIFFLLIHHCNHQAHALLTDVHNLGLDNTTEEFKAQVISHYDLALKLVFNLKGLSYGIDRDI